MLEATVYSIYRTTIDQLYWVQFPNRATLMISVHKKINLISLAIAISLVACTDEKAADNNQVTSVASTVTEDKVEQLQREAQAGDHDA